MMFSRVDLPEPDAPMMETNSPFSISRLMPLSTCKGACVVGFVYVLEEEHLLRLYVAGISVFPDGVRRPVPGGFSNIDA